MPAKENRKMVKLDLVELAFHPPQNLRETIILMQEKKKKGYFIASL